LQENVDDFIALRDERDELLRQNRQLRERTLDRWIIVAKSDASMWVTLRAMQSSFSWRVTKPLRVVRSIQVRAARIGYIRAVSMSGGYLRRAVGNRRRK
jgi:hypothetical protein